MTLLSSSPEPDFLKDAMSANVSAASQRLLLLITCAHVCQGKLCNIIHMQGRKDGQLQILLPTLRQLLRDWRVLELSQATNRNSEKKEAWVGHY